MSGGGALRRLSLHSSTQSAALLSAASTVSTPLSPLSSSSFSSSSFSCFSALRVARRHQASDQFHRYLHNPHIVQPDGLDSLPRTKGDQQQWLNTEQWDGYSDTYLSRFMQYPGTVDHPNPVITPKNAALDKVLALCYELYGVLSDELQELHDNPLHPRFYERIERLKKERERIAKALDESYAALHPTVKTVYDAFLVRRYYHLADWITHVERKRERVLDALSPAYMAQMQRARGVSEHFIKRLKHMESIFERDPTLGLMSNSELEQYSAGELALLRQKATYFRKMKRFGANQLDADTHTH